MRVVEKVVAYVTKGTHLLVFRHVDFDAGIQVPAGTLEPGESPRDGVLREAEEETGLDGLEVRRFLGARDYEMSPYGLAEVHRRYYFHLECKGDAPSTWRHFESHPSGCPSERIEFELYWVRLPDGVPELAGCQGDLLGELSVSPA
ncbi:MAG: NUDIX domain-containing protein [Chloroflexi bacterium]|nr:NUDIX domain-containing protein [Chloroflexota bacterium]